VLRSIRDPNIWRVYKTILLVGTAYGLGVAVIALHLDALGFHEGAIGGLAAWFAMGIVLLSIPAGRLVARWGAKRTLVGALAGYAASVSVFPLFTTYVPIALARFVDGACSACLWVSCETILLRRSDKSNKAHVMSVYAMAMAIGYVLGPLAAKLIAGSLPLGAAFVAAGVIAAASASYVALRLEPDAIDVARAESRGADGAEDAGRPRASAAAILARIKTSCFATFAYGYFEASVVLFLPLYLTHEKNIARDQTIAVPAFFAVGMLLFTNVAARLGDRHGHLFLMRILGAVGCATVLAFVALSTFPPMAFAVFLAGATIASISPVSLALQGVVTDVADYDRANSLYNAFYAAGILLGPPVSGFIFGRWGGSAMLFHLAAMWGAFVVFAIIYAADDPASARASVRPRAIPAPSPSSPSLDA
jgi:MFS family permease